MVIIALMMEAASTSETSVNFYQTTRRNNPENSYFHSRRRENLKSHMNCLTFMRCILTRDGQKDGRHANVTVTPFSRILKICIRQEETIITCIKIKRRI
jgi:hypothetical protein